jgi:hypothetical protein
LSAIKLHQTLLKLRALVEGYFSEKPQQIRKAFVAIVSAVEKAQPQMIDETFKKLLELWDRMSPSTEKSDDVNYQFDPYEKRETPATVPEPEVNEGGSTDSLRILQSLQKMNSMFTTNGDKRGGMMGGNNAGAFESTTVERNVAGTSSSASAKNGQPKIKPGLVQQTDKKIMALKQGTTSGNALSPFVDPTSNSRKNVQSQHFFIENGIDLFGLEINADNRNFNVNQQVNFTTDAQVNGKFSKMEKDGLTQPTVLPLQQHALAQPYCQQPKQVSTHLPNSQPPQQFSTQEPSHDQKSIPSMSDLKDSTIREYASIRKAAAAEAV